MSLDDYSRGKLANAIQPSMDDNEVDSEEVEGEELHGEYCSNGENIFLLFLWKLWYFSAFMWNSVASFLNVFFISFVWYRYTDYQ